MGGAGVGGMKTQWWIINAWFDWDESKETTDGRMGRETDETGRRRNRKTDDGGQTTDESRKRRKGVFRGDPSVK